MTGQIRKRHKAVFNWSGGKDSALALYKALQSGLYDIVALLTTVNRDSMRSTMHALPEDLLRRQAESIGIPLHIVPLTPQGTMQEYEEAMRRATRHFQRQGVTHFIFGDIYLEDVRDSRVRNLAPQGIEVVEPLWGLGTRQVMEEFLSSGLRTVIVTTTAECLDESFIGRNIDRELLHDLPPEVDPCGENGEYHTLCYAGGMFRYPVDYSLGRPERRTYDIRMEDGTVKRFSYWFANVE